MNAVVSFQLQGLDLDGRPNFQGVLNLGSFHCIYASYVGEDGNMCIPACS